ncbi:SHOCT domain-containing protein [Clostridioides difficile]|nr:SHOCT domain-containing protein [Clostridioides difficile]MDN9574540.1 conjugal transfer protein [Clostridioides difficile]HBF4557140.1 conjugal transfer protein [Clostridioides difficile]HCQ5580218.1 conjugal transfer protein [Clostridioides difficile]
MKNKLIRYTIQLAMLKQLLEKELISIDEYNIVKNKLMKDYNIISDITT